MAATTGRGFLQEYNPHFQNPVECSHFFKSLKSTRRLSLCIELNHSVCSNLSHTLPDPLADFQELESFDVYAGDGHWHRTAAHDPIKAERKWAVGHFYTLNLRSHAMNHLAVADQEQRLHEHDMRALKRQTIASLRQGAPKGRKVLYAWDSACLDFEQWDYWKQRGGIYFVSRAKDNMTYDLLDEREIDLLNPVNHGIESDQLIMPNSGKPLRRIECIDPGTGDRHIILTNEMKLTPGLLAQIYRMRWDVEKVFDQFKNSMLEQKAWATSSTAKTMQAYFLCLAHNLMLLLQHYLEEHFSVTNVAEINRRQNRLEQLKRTAAHASRKVSSVYIRIQRLTKLSLKYIRCLRTFFFKQASLSHVASYLRTLYATL